MGKYQKWWDSLSPQMQTYLRAQPVWHDRDLWGAFVAGIAFGFVLGIVLI